MIFKTVFEIPSNLRVFEPKMLGKNKIKKFSKMLRIFDTQICIPFFKDDSF